MLMQSALSNEERQNLHRLLEEITRKMPEWIRDGADLEQEINDLQFAYQINLTDEQVKALINSNKAATDFEQQFVKDHGERLHPNISRAIQMALALGAVYYFPGMSATMASSALSTSLLKKVMGEKGAYAPSVVGLVNLILNTWLTEYSPRTIANQYLPQLMETYGPALLLGPAGMLVYHIATNEEVVETAGDFFDLMHGDLTEKEFQNIRQKYGKSLATMTMDEVVDDYVVAPVSWIWRKIKGSETPTQETISSIQRRPIVHK